MTLLWILVIAVVVVLLYIIATYNGLISLKTRTEEAWSDITVQLKRRYDLIPNLVSTVKGYAKHEKEVFEKVTKARAEAMSAKGLGSKAKAEKSLADALKSVFAIAENYPNLKANENFLKLQGELSETENKVEASRRFYNANVRDYNIRIKSFPANVVASSFNFTSKDLFDVAEAEKSEVEKAPKVEV
jgi:LemA protein